MRQHIDNDLFFAEHFAIDGIGDGPYGFDDHVLGPLINHVVFGFGVINVLAFPEELHEAGGFQTADLLDHADVDEAIIDYRFGSAMIPSAIAIAIGDRD